MPTNRKHLHNSHQHANDVYEEKTSAAGRFFFGILFTISELFLFGSIILFVYWVIQHDKGFAFASDRPKQFNLHGLLMMTGFIFFNGQAILIYKSFQCCKKIYNKIMHCILFVCSISAITIGLVTAIQAQHNVEPGSMPKHFYSLHSWAGLVTVGLFGLQFIFGFISFLVLLCCDKATSGYRAKMLPTHVTFGLVIFSLSVVTCVSGILQLGRFRLNGKEGKHDYKDILEPTIIINAVGCCLIGLGIVLPYIIRNCGPTKRSHSSLHVN